MLSRNSTGQPLNLIKSPSFTNNPSKSTCLYNAPSWHTVDAMQTLKTDGSQIGSEQMKAKESPRHRGTSPTSLGQASGQISGAPDGCPSDLHSFGEARVTKHAYPSARRCPRLNLLRFLSGDQEFGAKFLSNSHFLSPRIKTFSSCHRTPGP